MHATRADPYSQSMRIVSLVPHATELLFALGLGEQVVAVTHECDYPPQARERPRVTRDALPAGLSAREIDRAVRERTSAYSAITKKALTATSTAARISSRTFTPRCRPVWRGARASSATPDAGGAGGPSGPPYFG